MYTMAAKKARLEIVRCRKQGRYQLPQFIRHEVINKGCHDAGSSQTHSTGPKRRLSPVVGSTAPLLEDEALSGT
jgi:hypothetical protein